MFTYTHTHQSNDDEVCVCVCVGEREREIVHIFPNNPPDCSTKTCSPNIGICESRKPTQLLINYTCFAKSLQSSESIQEFFVSKENFRLG